MIPFLFNVAQTYYKTYGPKISRYTFVFPNRRAGLFFQQYLSQIAKQPVFSPEILTISDLFTSLSRYKKVDNIELLFLLYDIYKDISLTAETFDEFHFWGDMLINDFDDVDKYMVDAKQLFHNIHDLKEIENDYNFLSREQIEAIQRFWSSFLPIGESDNKKGFLQMWEVLSQLYTLLRERLSQKGLAYEGMIFREIAEKAKRKEEIEHRFEKIIFVGLNGHNKAEEILLSYLQKQGIADFYFDYSSPLVQDCDNKASFFISKNKTLFPSQLQLSPEELTFDKPKLEVIGIPSMVGQSKYIHSILERLIEENVLTSDKAINTAIVLPDENALFPTLYSIPESIEKVNVTMGHNLANTPISGFIDSVFDLHKSTHKNLQNNAFYHKNIISLLSHRYTISIVGEKAETLKREIIKYNKIFVPAGDLGVHPFLKHIFTPIANWHDMSEYLKTILINIQTHITNNTEKEPDLAPTHFSDIENEFIIEYYKTINKLFEVLKGSKVEMTIETYLKLLKKLVSNINIPFSGEPLAGLQIMGMLETRALDFENLIIMSMNEGIFPQKKAANSFIPYNLRKGFELPTYEHQDSIFAYHFYRMINRAKNIYLLYDTRTEGLQTGEVSRYYNQIKYLYPGFFDITEKLAVYRISVNHSPAISIKKTAHVLERLRTFESGGSKSLSASAINTYINCPLQFYLSHVEGLDEADEVSETIEASTFGTIFHAVMESLYHPLEGKMITADLLRRIMKDEKLLTSTIEKSFAENYFNTERVRHLTGQNFLTGEVIRKYTKQTLSFDIKSTPFTYVRSEEKIMMDYTLPSGKSVSLKGFIDRIDRIGDNIRIIDYKTGKGELLYKSMEDLFDKELKNRPKAIMQVFMYAHLYLYKHPDDNIRPCIYYLRSLFDYRFDPVIKYKESSTAEPISDFSDYRANFRLLFDTCIDEIFNPNIPFNQSITGEPCQWCQFADICGK